MASGYLATCVPPPHIARFHHASVGYIVIGSVRERSASAYGTIPVRAALPPHIGQPVSVLSPLSIATRRPSSVPT